ncbi:MAG TPA: hypothetical protein VGF24_00910 [Vicinamibacterales bacterium]|jgi:hypothetical protein
MRVNAPLFALFMCLVSTASPGAQPSYRSKNGILSWKTLILGGGFRVTAAIPLHGDFSAFGRLEIVRAVSAIGADAPPALLARIEGELAGEFRKTGRFTEVSIVDGPPPSPREILERSNADVADSLDAPMRPAAELGASDRLREDARQRAETLVITTEVIDYAPGNKWMQLLFLDLGNAVLTVRLSLFDKATGTELGRSVISSDNASKVVPSVLSPRSPLRGIAEGLADQVTRRQLGAER